MYNIPIIFYPKFPKMVAPLTGDSICPVQAHMVELPKAEIETVDVTEFGGSFSSIPTTNNNLIIDFRDDSIFLASHFTKWKDKLIDLLNPIGNVLEYKADQKIEIQGDHLHEINIYGAFPVRVTYIANGADGNNCQVEMVYDYFDQELIEIIEEFFKEEEFEI